VPDFPFLGCAAFWVTFLPSIFFFNPHPFFCFVLNEKLFLFSPLAALAAPCWAAVRVGAGAPLFSQLQSFPLIFFSQIPWKNVIRKKQLNWAGPFFFPFGNLLFPTNRLFPIWGRPLWPHLRGEVCSVTPSTSLENGFPLYRFFFLVFYLPS